MKSTFKPRPASVGLLVHTHQGGLETVYVDVGDTGAFGMIYAWDTDSASPTTGPCPIEFIEWRESRLPQILEINIPPKGLQFRKQLYASLLPLPGNPFQGPDMEPFVK